VLLTLHLLPRRLETIVPLPRRVIDEVLSNGRLGPSQRRAIGAAEECRGMRWPRFALQRAADVTAVLGLVALKRRLSS
jgi:hypothetical protein